MSGEVKLTAYFERIGFSGSIAPTLQTLEALHALQPAAIAFENINSLLGLPVPLDQASLNQKLLTEKRGGYCFELNLMFLRVLQDLGFEARGHLAKVLWGRQDSEGLHSDHMIITVDIGGLSFLADVGFGGLMLTAPLRLTPDMPQATPHGSYRITGEDPHLRLEAVRDGEWWPAYEFSLEPVDDAAYDQLNRDLNADPDWFLKHNLLVERVTPTARHVLFDTHVTTTTGEDRTHHSLANVGELRESLNTTFNITLPDADGLDTTLARLVARAPAGV